MPYLQQRKTLVRLVLITWFQVSRSVSSTDPSSGNAIPALLNSTSMRPKCLATAAKAACTCSGSVRSAVRKSAAPISPLMSTAATAAPSRVRRSTVSRPMAPAAPVTTQTLPSRVPTYAPAGWFEPVFIPWDLKGREPEPQRSGELRSLSRGAESGGRGQRCHRYRASWDAASPRARRFPGSEGKDGVNGSDRDRADRLRRRLRGGDRADTPRHPHRLLPTRRQAPTGTDACPAAGRIPDHRP